MTYSAYVLSDKTRTELEKKYPPRYSKFVGHHVTIEFPVTSDAPTPLPARVKVLGIKDSGDGLEALVVSVDGEQFRPDGKRYHVTWSLEPDKYSPKDSNELLSDYRRYVLSLPKYIKTRPQLLQ